MDCLPDGRTKRQSAAYALSTDAAPDMTLHLSAETYAEAARQYPHFTEEEREYVISGSMFYTRLLAFDGLMLHAAGLSMDGRGYAFSAPCGTGKSTHASLWVQAFGADRVTILNDDKPALRRLADGWYMYGTPWSGKTDVNCNARVPLAGICLLSQGTENAIRRLSPREALPLLMSQLLRPAHPGAMSRLLALLDKLLSEVPFYALQCTMSEDAARLSAATMNGTSLPEKE